MSAYPRRLRCLFLIGLIAAVSQPGCNAYDTSLLDSSAASLGVAPNAPCVAGATSGSCDHICPPGLADCDGDPANGCEVDLHSDMNCGGCGIQCAALHATTTCVQGHCAVEECAAGFANCNGEVADGCEAALNSLDHCGRCGASCQLANSEQVCTAQGCQLLQCNAGFGDCDGDPGNGCETPLTSLDNCGGCGVRCEIPGAWATCASGQCMPAGCLNGTADCDGNGDCETRLDSLMHCGGCYAPCELANASEHCGNGQCWLAQCDPGYGDCDNQPANGCETRLDSVTACGACGTRCEFPQATAACSAGGCVLGACEQGYADCDGIAANGCELDLSDPSVCGCGIRCDDHDPCTDDICQPDGSCLHQDNGSCSCPAADSCAGGTCTACGPSCSCNRDCSATSCDSVCSLNASCTLDVDNAEAATQRCSAGSRCNLDCNSVTGLCTQHCGAGATCDIDCYASGDCVQQCEAGKTCSLMCAGTGNCMLDCRGGARCIAHRCSGPNCELQCDGPVRQCGGGVVVCNRSCPD